MTLLRPGNCEKSFANSSKMTDLETSSQPGNSVPDVDDLQEPGVDAIVTASECAQSDAILEGVFGMYRYITLVFDLLYQNTDIQTLRTPNSNLQTNQPPAISKPTTVTTPQLLLDLQTIFATSTTFAPLLTATRHARAQQALHQPPNQKLKDEEASGRPFKLGHGGTLDPLASGVLIVGIGRGTKHLSAYLSSAKTYETVVLFGVGTATYDVEGEETARADATHVTRALVERRIQQRFLGVVTQVPPVYSGIKVDGIKAVEYVAMGKELPRELAAREVEVYGCEVLEFKPGGTHGFRYPLVSKDQWQEQKQERPETEQKQEHEPNEAEKRDAAANCGLPAARIRITVSSGFYVRSFAHDLGIACDSVATMASLHRSQQANFYDPS